MTGTKKTEDYCLDDCTKFTGYDQEKVLIDDDKRTCGPVSKGCSFG